MKELLEFTYSIPPKQMSFSVLMETVTSSSDQSFVTTASLPKGKIGGYKFASITQPGGVARSDVRPPDIRTVAVSIHHPHFRQYSFMEIGYEIISTAILSLPLNQEGQMSVTGERRCTEFW